MDKNLKNMKETAYQLGRTAFHKGAKCVPVSDKNLMEVIATANRNGGSGATVQSMKFSTELYKAWSAGWTAENLKSPV